METIKIHATDPVWGMQLGVVGVSVHDKSQCSGEFCCIHRPSDHPLKDAPLNWRADLRIMERLCECGVGHPDKDGMDHLMRVDPESAKWAGVHGCDGCCRETDLG